MGLGGRWGWTRNEHATQFHQEHSPSRYLCTGQGGPKTLKEKVQSRDTAPLPKAAAISPSGHADAEQTRSAICLGEMGQVPWSLSVSALILVTTSWALLSLFPARRERKTRLRGSTPLHGKPRFLQTVSPEACRVSASLSAAGNGPTAQRHCG